MDFTVYTNTLPNETKPMTFLYAQLHDTKCCFMVSKQHRQRAKRCRACVCVCDGILLESSIEGNDSWDYRRLQTSQFGRCAEGHFSKNTKIFSFFLNRTVTIGRQNQFTNNRRMRELHIKRNEPYFTAVHFDFSNCHRSVHFVLKS